MVRPGGGLQTEEAKWDAALTCPCCVHRRGMVSAHGRAACMRQVRVPPHVSGSGHEERSSRAGQL